MPLYESLAFPAQTAAGADVNVLVGTIELQDTSGVGVSRVVATPPAGFATGAVVTTFASSHRHRDKQRHDQRPPAPRTDPQLWDEPPSQRRRSSSR